MRKDYDRNIKRISWTCSRGEHREEKEKKGKIGEMSFKAKQRVVIYFRTRMFGNGDRWLKVTRLFLPFESLGLSSNKTTHFI